jgi:Ca-activated chloride channel family protein
MDTNVRLDHQVLAVEHDHSVTVLVEVVAPDLKVERRPLHLVVVIDRSASMCGAKLEAAKAATQELAHRLRDDDRLAVVAFDRSAELIVPLDRVDRARVHDAIARIRTGHSTNLSGGWLRGVEELRRCDDVDAVRRILLLTDGQATSGIVDPLRLVEIAAASKQFAPTTTIGFGEGFDEDLLAGIASASGGSTYFVESPEDAPGVFAQEFEELAAIVAQNVSVETVMSDDVKFLGVLNDYPVVDVPGGFQVELGDLFARERRSVLFGLFIPEVADLGVKTVGQVRVRYVELGERIVLREVMTPIAVNLVDADTAARTRPDRVVERHLTLVDAATARKRARDLADQGDTEAAAQLLLFHADALRSVGGAIAFEQAEVLEERAARISQDYDVIERKRLTTEAWRESRTKSVG